MNKSQNINKAVENLLLAMGFDLSEQDLKDTPQRVSKLWSQEFLAGYEMNPQKILSSSIVEANTPDAIFINEISFHSMCPHHLLPFRGKAHVAYIPAGKILGFNRIAKLVDCFTLRFTLQERATTHIAQALVDYLPARGAGCVLEAEHLCLAIPGDKHDQSKIVTSAFVGEFRDREDLRNRLLTTKGRLG